MEQDTEPSPPVRQEGLSVQALVRPVRMPATEVGTGGVHPPGPRPPGARDWFREQKVQLVAVALLGVALGLVPGLALAAGARIDSRAAERRAAAAEGAVRLWQQQAADATSRPASSGSTAAPVTGAKSGGKRGEASSSPSASPGDTPSPDATATRLPGDGVFQVGRDIEPGVWQSTSTGRCHWERLRDTRSNGPVIVGYGNPRGDATVTIRTNDDTFKTNGCGPWTRTG